TALAYADAHGEPERLPGRHPPGRRGGRKGRAATTWTRRAGRDGDSPVLPRRRGAFDDVRRRGILEVLHQARAGRRDAARTVVAGIPRQFPGKPPDSPAPPFVTTLGRIMRHRLIAGARRRRRLSIPAPLEEKTRSSPSLDVSERSGGVARPEPPGTPVAEMPPDRTCVEAIERKEGHESS